MRIDIFTIFPQMFESPLAGGIFKVASERELLTVRVHNIRDHTHDRHHTVDDYPYGGGAGMVFKPGPVFESVEGVRAEISEEKGIDMVPVVLLTPQGRPFSQRVAEELAKESHLMLICGHYEGIDERVAQYLATDSVSIGDYVLSGGELPALVLADAVIRLVPGVLGSPESPKDDSHSASLLEYPQYTRPENFRGWEVPDILLSGNHAKINEWRREQAILRTWQKRPDLLEKAELSTTEREFVRQLQESGQMV